MCLIFIQCNAYVIILICTLKTVSCFLLCFSLTGRPEYILVPFEESLDQTQVLHETLNIRLIGRPLLVPGKVGNALELKGRGQYADLGTLADTCMGNLGKCPQGITISAWMKFRSFENNMVFLSTGRRGILMLYKDGYILVSSGGRGSYLHL